MSILSVKNLSKSFGKLEVLNDISFNVEQGEVISIIGPSGSGKSTLLRCINQFEKIDSGECEICGINMTRNDENGKAVYADNKTLHDIRLKIGLVFQNFNLFPHMSVLKNITEAPVHVLKQDKAQAEQTAMELLGKMGLADKANEYPCNLSGGQQQRVSIARALALSPELLFFDEPTSALDPELTGEIRSRRNVNTQCKESIKELRKARSFKRYFIQCGAGRGNIYNRPVGKRKINAPALYKSV